MLGVGAREADESSEIRVSWKLYRAALHVKM